LNVCLLPRLNLDVGTQASRSSMVAFTAVEASHPSRSRTILSALELAAKLRGAFTHELY